MLINLTDVLTSEGKTEEQQVVIEMTSFSNGLEEYMIVEKSPLDLKISNMSKGKARVEGKAKIVLKMNCDRCLKEVDEVLNLDIFREVFAPDEIAESTDEKGDQTFMEGYQLNVEDLINDEILLSLPMKVLCKEDCKGICRQCGKDLNEGECGCDTFVPDPRMAVIKDIFNANKEV
ncbi:MAG: DUF177 domain-containing protein [Lachnospiraceae bacterium]|nr:DUF177 domain-containing protein [Lachnospiraceae bacterium]